jgi:gliding motility associated protien GldN
MNNKIKYLIIIIFFGLIFKSYSQSNILNATDPKDIGYSNSTMDLGEDYLEYGYVDDKDILFSKMVWETIDLRQRVNFPYLYPIDFDAIGHERRPLLYFIREAIGHELNSEKIFDDSNFNRTKTDEEIENLWKMKKPLADGESSLQGIPEFIEDQLLDNRTIEGAPIFPYFYDQTDSPVGTGEFTYEDFQGLYNDYYNPGEQSYLDRSGNVLDEDEQEVFLKIAADITRELWIEDVHFEWINFKYEDLLYWRIKGLWYFDKIQSELKYRLIAIAPVAKPLGSSNNSTNSPNDQPDPNQPCVDADGYDVDCDDPSAIPNSSPVVSAAEPNNSELSTMQNEPQELFWLYYPHLRDILTNKRARVADEDGKASRVPVVFSEKNSSVRKTFDELLISRRFNTMIYKEENVYVDRDLYKVFPNNSFMRLLESERIKEKIRNLEHDMWSW